MSGISPVTGGAGRWNSSWSEDIACAPNSLALPGRDKQTAAEMAIAAEKDGTSHSGAKHEGYMAEQPSAGPCEGLGNLDLRSRESGAPAFGEKIGFECRNRVAQLRVPRHAIRRQAFPCAHAREQRIVLHLDIARGERKPPCSTSAQFSKIIQRVFERSKIFALTFRSFAPFDDMR